MFTNVIIGMINTIISENEGIRTFFQQSEFEKKGAEIYAKANAIYSLYSEMLNRTPGLLSEANNTIFCEIWKVFVNNLECLKDYNKTALDMKEKLNMKTFDYVTVPEQKKKEIIEASNKIIEIQRPISSNDSINMELYKRTYLYAYDVYESGLKYLQAFPGLSFSFKPILIKLMNDLKYLEECMKRDEFPTINRSPEWYRKKVLLGTNSDYEIVSNELKSLCEYVLNLQKNLNQSESRDNYTKVYPLFGSRHATKVFSFELDHVLFYVNVPVGPQTPENPNIICGFTAKDEQGRYFRKGIQFNFNYQNSFTSFYTNDKGNLEDDYIEPRYWEKHDEYNKIIYFDPVEGRCTVKPLAYMEGGLNPNGYAFEEMLETEKYMNSHKVANLESPFHVFTNYKDYETAIDILKTNIDFFKKNWTLYGPFRDSEHYKTL